MKRAKGFSSNRASVAGSSVRCRFATRVSIAGQTGIEQRRVRYLRRAVRVGRPRNVGVAAVNGDGLDTNGDGERCPLLNVRDRSGVTPPRFCCISLDTALVLKAASEIGAVKFVRGYGRRGYACSSLASR